jgi:hypothetical protein
MTIGAAMLMPKTSVNKHNAAKFGKHQIWLTRQVCPVQAKPVA